MSFVANDLAGLASFKALAWSYFEKYCALIPSDGSVHFINDHGIDLQQLTINRDSRATCIEFSSESNTLAIGWADGKVSIWRDGSISDQSSSTVHTSGVTLISWHPTLPMFLTVSETGEVCCWDSSTSLLPAFRGASNGTVFDKAVWAPREVPFAFLSSTDGKLYSFENAVECINEICECEKPIHHLTISPGAARAIVISGDNYLSQYSLPPNVAKQSQVKLPVGNPPVLLSLKSDVMAYAIGDAIYLWNVQADETHILRTQGQQRVTSLHWSDIDARLFATTSEGHIVMWQCTMRGLVNRLSWQQPKVFDCGVKVDIADWSRTTVAFAATCTGRRPSIFRFTPYHPVCCREFSVWQGGPDLLMIEGQPATKVTSPIEDVQIGGNGIVVITNGQAEIFSVRGGALVPFSRMAIETSLVAVRQETVFACSGGKLEVRNLQGTVKQTVNLGGTSEAKLVAVNGKYLTIYTSDHQVFLFDVSRRSPKMQLQTVFSPDYEHFRVREISMSCGGFCISLTLDYYRDGKWIPSPFLYLHSPQFDKTVTVKFDGRIPVTHKWDTEDTRLLCVQAVPYSNDFESTMSGVVIVPLFVADSLDSFRQTSLTIPDGCTLVSVELPRIYHQVDTSSPKEGPVPVVLPQFEGLDNADEASRKALMELNFHLATGDIDAAFNSIRNIDNKGTWRSLAQTCAQMRRIDLCDLCFGKMEDGGSAMLLHEAKARDDSDQAAMVVVDTQLGMYDEAKALAKESRRFDLLAEIHESLGEWQDVMRVANASDRIHMKARAYQNARSLEIRGDVEEAIKLYETSGTIEYELPRVALQANDLRLLFNYIADKTPAEIPSKLCLWIARFYEAHQQMERALEYYEYAHAQEEAVRLLCCLGRWDDASNMVKRSNKRSVICNYARLLITRIEFYSQPENHSDKVDVEKMKHDVVELFRKARQFAQAMDFALRFEMVDDILALSFSAPAPMVCRAAQWFEEQREAKNAILLYSRSGRMNRALALCFAMKQYDALDEISDSLNSQTDPQVLMRCGKYFAESERWSKAAQCLAFARQFDEVIEICKKHAVRIQPSVIQELAEIKADTKVLARLAELCEQQGEYTLAANLYVKLKDHLAAMKALIRSGNTEKVIKFANLVRKKEMYILAANYIQTQNPREGQPLFETTVNLYKKAGAPDKLARLYEASAQVEIDEYQEYKKGLELILKAKEIITNLEGLKNKQQRLDMMSVKINWIEKYLRAIDLIQKEPKKSLSLCVELLKAKGIENCLRPDDIYIVMVQCYAGQGNYKNAHKILEDLRKNGTDITWFMDVDAIQKIYSAVGAKFDAAEHADDDYDVVDDDAIEDIQDV